MNKKIYIGTIVVSILLLIPACIWQSTILTVLSGIGCSGIAAAIMAIFLDDASIKKENKRKARVRAIYLRDLKEELKMMLERILWFEKRLDEEYDWDREPSFYSSFNYMIYAGQQYPSEEKITFQEAEFRLKALADKYSLEKQSQMEKEHLHKVQKMFFILYISGLPLLSEVNSINENRIALDAEEYLSL